MPFNGSGVFTPPAADFPAVAMTLIQSSKFNNVINDIANNGLSFALTKDGQQTATANQPMGGFRHTGVGAASASGQYGRVNEIQDGSLIYGGTAGGTADALTISTSPSFAAYATGMHLLFKSGASPNTGAATLQVNGIASPKAIQINGAALVAGAIEASKFYLVIYDGAAFQLLKISSVFGVLLTALGITVSTDRLAGRDTAGTGALEEISVGGGLEFTGSGGIQRSALTGDATASAGSNATTVVSASDTVAGKIEIATQSEVNAMTDTTRAITSNHNKIVLGTEQATTSGTSVDFTGIPAGVRRITVNLVLVSTNGTSNYLINIGDSGGIENTGYVSHCGDVSSAAAAAQTNSTVGFIVSVVVDNAGTTITGTFILSLEDGSDNTWNLLGTARLPGATDHVCFSAGSKALSAELDRVRITTVAGNTFDTGAINISYER